MKDKVVYSYKFYEKMLDFFSDNTKILPFYYSDATANNPKLKSSIIRMCLKKNILPYIEKIWIETVNFCNCDCPFCPIGLNMNKDKPEIMSDEMFYRIVKMIHEYDKDWSGTISPFGHGEPLLDPKIFDRIDYIKEQLPKCRINMSTNGILLPNRMNELVNSKLDYLIVNFYKSNTEKECYKSFLDYKTDFKYYVGKFCKPDNKLHIYFRRRFNLDETPKYEEWFSNRTGVMGDLGGKPIDSPCILPFLQLSIDIHGNSKFCCFDALGTTIYDNIFNHDSIEELWNSDKRKEMLNKVMISRFNLDTCKNCNTDDRKACENMYS
jgi:MoaA/NifB/PqqE/SkfB family radical SAM enzyme